MVAVAAKPEQIILIRYTSKLKRGGHVPESDSVQSIATALAVEAADKNRPKRIGGVLRFAEVVSLHNSPDIFVAQALEGPIQAVNALYEKISADKRHTIISVSTEKSRRYRKYETFGMMISELPNGEGSEWVSQEDLLWIDTYSNGMNMPTALRLTYRSVLVADNEEKASKLTREILFSCLKNNPELQIGGILFRTKGQNQLTQVLEGPPDRVAALVERIKQDPRHADFRVVREVFTEHRRYLSFGMLDGGDWDSSRPEDEDPFEWAVHPTLRRIDKKQSRCSLQ